MATLINGNGNSAVYAQQDADWFRAVAGGVTQIMPVGNQMAYEIEDANTIAVKDGGIITKEGRRIQIDVGTIDEFLIPTGTQGTTNYFIIGYHLYRDDSSNELCETFVQLMNSATDTIQEDTFRGGATDVYVSLYRITQVGVNIDTVAALLSTYKPISQMNSDIAELNANLSLLTDNDLGAYIDIISYSTEGNKYTFPSDGYVFIQDTNGASISQAVIYGSVSNSSIQVSATNYKIDSIFVRKGMRCYIYSAGTGARARFYPLQ